MSGKNSPNPHRPFRRSNPPHGNYAYNAEDEHLREVLQKHFKPKKLPPITKWIADREAENGKKAKLNRQFSEVWHNPAAVEKIKRNLDDILNEVTGERQSRRTQDIDR